MSRHGIEARSSGPLANTVPTKREVNNIAMNLNSVRWAHFIHIKMKLATVFEGNPKAPFSIVITPRCTGGGYFFPGLLHFSLDTYLIMQSVKQGGIKYYIYIYIYIYICESAFWKTKIILTLAIQPKRYLVVLLITILKKAPYNNI